MRTILYRITLREPLLATSLQGDPNSSVSLDYVPGSLIRGALIQDYIRKHSLHTTLLTNTEAQALFFDGGVRFLHAYPLTAQDQRSLPTPRALLRRKHDELDEGEPMKLLDASHPTCTAMLRAQFEQSDTLKPLGAPFCASVHNTLYTYRPDRTIAVHIQRNPVKGRSLRTVPAASNAFVLEGQSPDGAVFRYDALAPEQQFQGVVLVDDDTHAELVQGYLEELNTCWLGRSRSAQYGKTTISDSVVEDDWRECNPDDPDAPELAAGSDQLHSLTFLSDALVRDTNGQPIARLDTVSLAAYLGLEKDMVEIDDEHSFSATTEIGGFNRAWQLPLTQEHAISAGSVISFRLSQSLPAESVTKLEQSGIGGRRIEGYGRIAFDWRGELERSAQKGKIATISFVTQNLESHSQALARRMARQLYDRHVEQHIVDFVQTTSFSRMPEKSQLGHLRVLVRQAQPTGDVAFVHAQFQAFKSTAKRQFERARIGNQSFDEWITDLLTDPSKVWIHFNAFHSPIIAEQAAERDDQQVALRLLAAVLANSARDEREQEEQQ